MDVAFELGEFISRTRFEDLPGDVVETTKKLLLDSMACMIAGSTAQGCREVVDLFNSWGGRQEATILVYGHKVPSVWAAFANGMMMHSRDFDETHDAGSTHTFVGVLPAALAASEHVGSVDGKTFLTAVAVSVEVVCRLASAAKDPMTVTGWDFPAISSCFGAAAAAAKIFDYSAAEVANTWGIAYSNVSGTLQVVVDGALTKRMGPAFNIKNGVLAALLSARKITGVINVFEGKWGYFNQYERGHYARESLTKGLGSDYDLVNLSIKPYPSCRYPHASIDAALSLARRGTFSADEVERIKVYLPPAPYGIVGGPFKIRGNPTVDAQFSVPYCVAAALLRKDVFIPDFEETSVCEPKVMELAGKVVCFPDESVTGKAMVPVRVEVILKNGKVEKERVDAMKGSPQNPLSYEEVIKKFQRCLEYAAKPFSDEKMFNVADLIKKLELVKDIDEIVKNMVC